MSRTFVIGARKSQLSLRQVDIVATALRTAHPDCVTQFREITTQGDTSKAPLSQIGGLGVFTKAIEDALLSREIDIAIHSLKDLPPLLADGLLLGAVPPRGDVRDALITRGVRPIEQLRRGARVGTGSARRTVQLKALRPDLDIADIRGNVPTRMAKVESSEYDAIVLALAGLERLMLAERAAHIFSLEEMVPAVGQGALGVEVRADDAETMEFVSAIDHEMSRVAVTAERAFLERLGVGCMMPVGAHATLIGGDIQIRAILGIEGGLRVSERIAPVKNALALARQLADELQAPPPPPAPEDR
jgi:hydroxymethylbilane synthase